MSAKLSPKLSGHRLPLCTAVVALGMLLFGCAESTEDDSNTNKPPLGPDLGWLNCPSPGPLPFHTQTFSFEDKPTAEAAINRESQDTTAGTPQHTVVDYAGNPGDPQVFSGQMVYGLNFLEATAEARVQGLPEEHVALWTHATGAWTQIGRTRTDETGRWEITIDAANALPQGVHAVYAVVEGDQTCQTIAASVLPSGSHVIVTDIDETMTIGDEEAVNEMLDPTDRPKLNEGALELIQTYHDKGYYIFFLTARSFHLQNLSRFWLTEQGFPLGHLQTAFKVVGGDDAVQYKGGFINRLQNDLGYDVFAVYGNAETDIDGYALAGIPLDRTFIIGHEAGTKGTVAIDQKAIVDGENAYSYRDHIDTFVANEVPDAVQP